MPPSRTTAPFNQAPWHYLIQPYVKSYQLFKCPSNTASGTYFALQGTTGQTAFGVPAEGIPRSYQSNSGVGGEFTGGGADKTLRPMQIDGTDGTSPIAKLNFPATTILVHEQAGGSDESFSYGPDKVDGSVAVPSGSPPQAFTNHLTTTNFLFVDGHVKSLKPSSTCNATIDEWANSNAPDPNCILRMGAATAFLNK